MKFSKMWVLAAASLICIPAIAQQQRPLRFELESGSTYYTQIEQDQQIQQQMRGQTMSYQQKSGFGWDMEVGQQQQDATWVELTYDWVMLEVEGPGVSIAYDSQVDPNDVPEEATGFAALRGLSFRTLVGQDGQVQQVAGLEEMKEQFRQQLPSGPMGDALMADMQAYVTEDMIKQQMHYRLAGYPEQDVAAGDSWQKSIEVVGPFGMMADYEWTVEQFEDDTAVLDVQAELTRNPDADAEQLPEDMEYELEGSIEGTSDIELETGLVRSSDLQMDMQVLMHMSAEGQEMTMPTDITGTIRSSVEGR